MAPLAPRRRCGLAGADRPDRLVGDDDAVDALVEQLDRRAELAPDDRLGLPASRSASVSPTQTIGTRPCLSAAAAFCATSRSLSPCSARRSEWPTMTWQQPNSASIAAEISPV
jgi:hypothetical protein